MEFQSREFLLFLSMHCQGDWKSIYSCIQEKKRFENEEIKQLIESNKEKYITLIDPEYPERLKYVFQPPFVLYYEGNLNLLENIDENIAVVGSRNACEYGLTNTSKISKGLAEKGFKIVSGLAKGIDSAALKEGIKYKNAIAVLGTPLSDYYPLENRELQRKIAKDGLLLSEYPKGAQISQNCFPARNRIVAALSKAVLIGQAARRSGTLITVTYELNLGGNIGCIPYPINGGSEGSNHLLKEGAFVVEDVEDAIDLLGNGKNFQPSYK